MSQKQEKSTVLDRLKDISESFWSFFVFHRRMAIMVGLIFVMTGVVSFFRIPRESQPEVKIPFATVTTVYQGASPTEVANQVTFRIEQEIKALEDLQQVTSTSSEGISQIFVEFDAKADIEDSIRKLKDQVDAAKGSLPEDATDPVVQEASFDSGAIIIFSLFGDLPYDQLLDSAKAAQEELENIRGVQSADITGERERHILVSVRETDMIQYNLSLRTISQAIQSFSLSSPVGSILTDDQFYQVRIESDQDTEEAIENIPITVLNGATIYVRDVADVSEDYRQETSVSRVSNLGEPSKNAISINIIKKTGENVIETVEEARQVFSDLKEQGIFPDELEVVELNDTAKFIEEDFNRLMGNALQTVGLIFIILLLALGFKEAFIGGISIPFTFFVTFTYLQVTGATFNFMVLFSLILGLGLLVDATIVIMEGMHENLYKKNLSPVNAALETIKTYRFPLISGMLTTIAAFVPMLLVSGIMGEFFKFIPITVSTVLISSLVIGLFFMPAYSVLLMRKAKKNKKPWFLFRILQSFRDWLINGINRIYHSFLSGILGRRLYRFLLFFVSLLTFASALALPALGFIKIEAFPLVDIDFISVTAEMPAGTSLEKMDPVARKIETILQKDKDIKNYVVNVNEGSAGSSATANFNITLVDEEERELKSFEKEEEYKVILNSITEADITLSESRSGPPSGAAIQVLIFGEDPSILKQISNDIQAHLRTSGGAQVGDDLDDGAAEFTFDFSQAYQKALLRQQGLTASAVAQEVRMAVFPTTVTTIKRGDEEIDVNIQRDWGGDYPTSINEISKLPIQNQNGQYIPLVSLDQPSLGAGLTAIRNFDGEQAVTVSSEVAQGKVAADVVDQLTPFLESYDWPAGYTYELAGGNDETMQSFEDLFNAMGISILLILLILITQFDSFKQPFVILMSLPLSLIGVFYGFLFFNLKLGLAAMIGIVALSGIVINDAIILIDRINNNRDKGMKLKEAIEEAGPARLQPIIITSVTTVLGILPIALTDPFWLTLGMAIAFGMIFSTVLTLVIVPVLYYSFERRGEMKRLKKHSHKT